jgi:hypothetical protein
MVQIQYSNQLLQQVVEKVQQLPTQVTVVRVVVDIMMV